MHGGCSRLPWGLPSRPAPLPFGPPLPLVVLPPDGVSTLRYARGPVPPKRRAAAIIGFAPFPLPPPPLAQMASSAGGKSLRARCGVPLRPPCARWPPSSVASGGGVVSRQPPLSSSHSGGASAQPPSPPPSPPASLCAGKQGRGGLLQRPLAAAPLRRRAPPLRPRPPVLAPGRGYFGFAAAGLGIAPPAGGAKGLWVRCTWLRHQRHASCDAGTIYSALLNRIALHLDELQDSC